MTETKKAPNLRFKGFTDDWEQRKLGELFKERAEKSGSGQLLSVSISQGVSPFDESIRKNNSSKDKHNYKVVKINDIAYNSMRMWQGAEGIATVQGIVSPAYTVIIPNSNANPLFFESLFKTSKMLYVFRSHSQGLTSDTWNLKYPLLKKIYVNVPKIHEQEKIANLIRKTEALLSLQQRKLDKLSLLQKSLLQTLFANDNSEKPELRFSEFKDNWNNKKIGTVFTESKQKSANGQLLSVSIASGVHPFDETERKNNSSQNKSNYKFVEKNDIAYNSMRMWQGSEGVSYYTGIVSPAYTVLHPKEDNNSEFYAYMFKRAEMLNKFRRYSQGLTSDTWNLKFPILKTINIKTTNSDEQTKIVQLFKVIEKHINLEQKKLDRYQSIKKFLLQQMFI